MEKTKKTLGEKIKVMVYLTIADVDRQIKEKKGVIGKSVNRLEIISANAKERCKEAFYSAERLDIRYSGIGSNINKTLFREDYESCLRFIELAEKKIPSSEKLREQILNDIRSSASKNEDELVHFYRSVYYPWNVLASETILAKTDIAEEYLLE